MKVGNALAVTLLLFMLVASSGVAPAVTFQVANAQTNCPSNTIFHLTLPLPPDSVNALIAGVRTSFVLAQLMFNGAYPVAAPDGSLFMPDAFDSWSVNSNYTIWTFNVPAGLTWSNGVPANASDILATYGPNFALNATYDFPNLAGEIKQEYAANSSAAVYVLNTPDAHLGEKMSFMYFSPIYPASIISKDGASAAFFDSPSLGPFYIASYTPGAFQMTLYRNQYYKPTPNICEVELNFVESYSLTATFLQSGQTDLAPVEPANVQAVLGNSHIKLYTDTAEAYTGLQYNVTSYPYNMTAFRQALAYGINESAVLQQGFFGYGITAYNSQGMIPSTVTSWYNPGQKSYSYNTTEATSLLNSIGINKGSDGHFQYPNGTDVSLTLWTDTDQTWDQTSATAVQQSLQNLGLKINLITTSQSALIGDYHANIDGAQQAMLLYTNAGVFLSSTFLDTLPGWDTTWGVASAPSSGLWEYPTSINAQYQSNLTAYSSTANATLEKTYVNNIQAINSQYLPMLTLAYPDYLWGANTLNWGNWPSGYIMFGGNFLNRTALATLVPTSGSTTTGSSTTNTVTNTNTATTSSGGSSGSSPYLIPGIIVVAAAIIIVAAVTMLRRRT